MDRNTYDILFSTEVPVDLFAPPHVLLEYDVLKNASTGAEVTVAAPYNAVSRKWTTPPEEKLTAYLAGRFMADGYVVRVPVLNGTRFPLLVEKGGRRIIIVHALSGEDEKKVWQALAVVRNYTVVVIREYSAPSMKGEKCITVDEALGTFNFQTL